MGTFSHPSDPVTNGATLIQASVLNAVAGDYVDRNYDDMVILARRYKESGYNLRYFPFQRDVNSRVTWRFALRKDLSADAAVYSNIFGFKTTNFETGYNSGQVKVMDTECVVYSWRPKTYVGTIHSFVHWVPDFMGTTLTMDPETGLLDTSVGNARALRELSSFIMKETAASVPTFEPLSNIYKGIFPL